jgi:hypothetical protein
LFENLLGKPVATTLSTLFGGTLVMRTILSTVIVALSILSCGETPRSERTSAEPSANAEISADLGEFALANEASGAPNRLFGLSFTRKSAKYECANWNVQVSLSEAMSKVSRKGLEANDKLVIAPNGKSLSLNTTTTVGKDGVEAIVPDGTVATFSGYAHSCNGANLTTFKRVVRLRAAGKISIDAQRNDFALEIDVRNSK